MIYAKLLNSEASLNNFFELDAIEYVPGENLTLAVRLFDSQRQIRYIPPLAATLEFKFLTTVAGVDTELDIAGTVINADDRSMWSVELTPAQTELLSSGNVQLTLDVNGDASVIYKTVLRAILTKRFLSGDDC